MRFAKSVVNRTASFVVGTLLLSPLAAMPLEIHGGNRSSPMRRLSRDFAGRQQDRAVVGGRRRTQERRGGRVQLFAAMKNADITG